MTITPVLLQYPVICDCTTDLISLYTTRHDIAHSTLHTQLVDTRYYY